MRRFTVVLAAAIGMVACSDSTPPPPPPAQANEPSLNQQLDQATIGKTPENYAGKGTLIDAQARELQRAKDLQKDLNKAVEAQRDAIDKME